MDSARDDTAGNMGWRADLLSPYTGISTLRYQVMSCAVCRRSRPTHAECLGMVARLLGRPAVYDVNVTCARRGPCPCLIVVDPSVVMTRMQSRSLDGLPWTPVTRNGGVTLPAALTSTLGLGSIHKCSAPPTDARFQYNSSNGFATAFMLAYNYHLPLRLSPDVVWLTIVQSLAKYINDNAETFRTTFVDHGKDTKVKLNVMVPLEWDADHNLVDWDGVLSTINELITANTKVGVTATLAPAFSTTTLTSTTACTIATMSAMQAYFQYGMTTCCGIGEVVMEGTAADWQLLRAKSAGLGSAFGTELGTALAPWLHRLDGVLQQLAATAEGRPTAAFWQHAYSSETRHGSGGGTFLTGWFLDFYFAGSPTRPGSVNVTDIPQGVVDVPFFWQHLNGKVDDYKLVAGTWSAYADERGVVGAVPQWAVADDISKHKKGMMSALADSTRHAFFHHGPTARHAAFFHRGPTTDHDLAGVLRVEPALVAPPARPPCPGWD